MDWFENITGFTERDYAQTQALLRVEGGRLHSKSSPNAFGVGHLGLPSLGELRSLAGAAVTDSGRRTTARNLSGDVRALHAAPEMAGALFQVASQFNLLEMVGPHVSPEDGVTRYQFDRTQGPACAMAAGAATIYRNYFAPVAGGLGQTSHRQIDALAEVGERLSELLARPVAELWTMSNGYALCTAQGLKSIAALLRHGDEDLRDDLRGRLRIGWQRDVEVTDVALPGPRVSQAFCSALPVSYSAISQSEWEPLARLVLEAAYEATMAAAAISAASGGSNVALLTRLGGGAFGNADGWIDDAISRALNRVEFAGLDIVLVHYTEPPKRMIELARRWS